LIKLHAFKPAPERWDAFAAAHPQAHILQTPDWGRLKAAFGWRADRIALADESGVICAGAQILYRRLPFRLGTLAYIPKGPLTPPDWWDGESALMAGLWQIIHRDARQHGTRWLKVEAPFEESEAIGAALRAAGFRPSAQTVQPPRTVLLDITGDEESILAAMKQKTRYNIRLSTKKEVTVREGTRADLASFNAMMQVTGRRDGFGVHAPDYYRRAYDLFAPSGRAALLIASYAGRDLAGVMVFAVGKTAWYFYGASTDEERQRMPTYAVQWEAIRWARARGCTVYDLWGIPDADQATLEAEFEKRQGDLWGVYRFKRGFGGRVVRQMPAWDCVYNPPIYALYRLFLRLTRRDDAG